MQTWLRRVVIGGLFIIPFIPFIVANPLFFPFITGKGFAFRILIEIVFAVWAIWALRDPAVRPRWSMLLYIFGGLVLVLGLADALGMNPEKAFWSNFERMEGWVSFVHLGLYLVVLTSVMKTEKLWRAFWNTWIISSVIMACYGVLQIAGALTINQGGVRVDGTFGNATYLAVFMLFNFFLTLLALVKWEPKRWMQIWYVLALILQASMIFYAATRGTILGLLGGLFLAGLIFVIFAKGQKQLRLGGAGLAIALLVIVGGFFLIKDAGFIERNQTLSRFASITSAEAETRLDVWRMAGKGIMERPVLGWGQDGFNYVFNKYYEPSMYAQEPWFDRAHNQFLDMAIAGGIPSFLLYIALFFAALWYLWKGKGFDLKERAILTGLLAAYAFHNLFVFDNLISYILFVSVMAYAASRREVPAAGKVLTPSVVQGASAVIVIALLAGLWFVNMPGLTRAYDLIEAVKPHGNDLTENLAHFQTALKGGGVGIQEAQEQFIQFAVQIQRPELASLSTPEFRTNVVALAKTEFLNEVNKVPDDARLRLFYGSFLRQGADYAAATTHLEKAHELSPGKQAIMFELGLLAANQGDGAAALNWFKTAYELEPNFDEARLDYAALLIRAQMPEMGKALLVERYQTATPNEDTILQAYLAVGNYTDAIKILESRVAATPTGQAYLQLAAGYLQAGRRADAVLSIRKAIELDPSLKEQGEYYITEIEAGRNP